MSLLNKPKRFERVTFSTESGEDSFEISEPINIYSPPTIDPHCNLPVFSYTDHNPSIHYTRDPSEANSLVDTLQGPVGFDMEWRVVLRRNMPERRTALVQVADSQKIIIIHLHHMDMFPTHLRELIECRRTPKVGANILNDGRKLYRDYGVLPQNLVELGAVAKIVDPLPFTSSFGKRKIVSLAKLVAKYCQKTLEKGSERTGNWEVQRLDPFQLHYAANDVYAGLKVFQNILSIAPEDQIADSLAQCNQSVTDVFQDLSLCPLRDVSNIVPTSGARLPGEVLTPDMEMAGMRPQFLRAYRYWHWKGHDIKTLATQLSLKDNGQPLKFATVISYIISALQIAPSLPFSMARLRLLVLADIYAWPRHKDWLVQAWKDGRGR